MTKSERDVTKTGPPTAESTASDAVEDVAPRAGKATVMKQEEFSPDEVARILRERAQALSRRLATEEELEEFSRIVSFSLGEETYAVDVAHVDKIYPLEELTPVPCAPDFVAGVVNLRGQILSVLDIHRFLGLEGIEAGQGSQVITVSAAGLEVGLLVDHVHGVHWLRRSELQPALPTTARIAAEYTLGVTPDMIVLLDLKALLGDEKIVVRDEMG